MKVRGPAAHIYERYLQLARDASSSGDRVMAENYLQHAEHYFRVLRAMQPAMPPQPQMNDRFGHDDFDDEEGLDEGELEGADGPGQQQPVAAAAGEQPDVEFPGEPQQRGGGQQQDFNRNGGDDFRRGRRGRRGRFRPMGENGEREGGGEEGGGQGRREFAERGERPERAERREAPEGEGRRERREPQEGEPRRERREAQEGRERREPQEGEGGGGGGRRERRPRERAEGESNDQAGEGFSSGPRPAFLGSD